MVPLVVLFEGEMCERGRSDDSRERSACDFYQLTSVGQLGGSPSHPSHFLYVPVIHVLTMICYLCLDHGPSERLTALIGGIR